MEKMAAGMAPWSSFHAILYREPQLAALLLVSSAEGGGLPLRMQKGPKAITRGGEKRWQERWWMTKMQDSAAPKITRWNGNLEKSKSGYRIPLHGVLRLKSDKLGVQADTATDSRKAVLRL
jgi:hypothetical protein